jgi:nucleotide-binding universal stress UspA family protein
MEDATMIRSILLAIDGFGCSAAALQSAITIAGRCNANIAAFGIVDTPWIITPQGKVEQLGHVRRRAQDALRQLQSAAVSEGIAVTTAEAKGDPIELLTVEATRHGGVLDLAINALVRDGSRAVLAVREKPASADRILVAFDGSVPASRSMHMAALLGLAQSGQVQVLSINADDRAAEELAERAATLLRSHGPNVTAFGIGSETDPAEIILSHAKTFEADMVVMAPTGTADCGI